jgi:hypothetical protein
MQAYWAALPISPGKALPPRHSTPYPSTLRIDGINGDYGPGFLGYTLNTGTYVKHDQEFGWLSFSGELEKEGDWITVTPTNADRTRVFIADLGLWLTLDAG